MKILQKQTSASGKEKSMYSAEDFHVSRSALPDSEEERKITATSGRKCYEPYKKPSPLGLLVKTLLESSQWYNPARRLKWSVQPLFSERVTRCRSTASNSSSKPSAKTLSKRDIPSSRFLFRLVPSERRTEETGYGLLQDDYKVITTKQGKEIIVDKEDYDFLNQWAWKVNNSGYAYRTIRAKKDGKKWKTILMHRSICCAEEKEEIDHINRNKLDNRKSNLRIIAHWENSHNRSKGTGVRKPKGRNKWYAQIYVNNKRIHLGCFKTKEEAMNARINAEKTLLPTVQTQGLKVCNKEGRTEFIPLSLLPTPNASEGTKWTTKYNPNSQMGTGLTAMAVNGLLPTPMACEIRHSKRVKELKEAGGDTFHSRANGETRPNGLMDYMDFMDMLPTPRANKVNDVNLNSPAMAQRNKGNLEESIAKFIQKEPTFQTGETSQLNPLFVAEMMGFPADWTVSPFLHGEKNQ